MNSRVIYSNDLKNRACSAEVPASRRLCAGVLARPCNPREDYHIEYAAALARARAVHSSIPSLHPATVRPRLSSDVPMRRMDRRHAK